METNMPLAISTDYAGDFPEIEKIEHSLQKIAEHGFSHVHWCFDWDGDYIYAKSEIEQIGVWLEKYHLKCKGIHASKGSARFANQTIWHYKKDYTSSIESSRLAGTDLIRNRVDLARRLNCHELVLHMYLPFLDFSDAGAKKRFYENSLRSLDELEPYCRDNQVKICIENLFEAPADLQLEQFDILTNRYSPDYLGLCIDTGHANLVWGEKFTEALVQRYSDRIFAVHIHDNLGPGRGKGYGDAHAVPGDGVIHWEKFMEALRHSVYEPPLVLELNKPAEEDEDDFLCRAYNAGIRLTKMGYGDH